MSDIDKLAEQWRATNRRLGWIAFAFGLWSFMTLVAIGAAFVFGLHLASVAK